MTPNASFCSKCGAQLAAAAAFCHKCGAPASDAPAASTSLAAAPAVPETEIWSGGFSARALTPAWLFSLAFACFAAGAAWLLIPADRASFRLPLTGVGLVPFLWVLLRFIAARLSIRYRLTTERLFCERGVLSRDHTEVELARVDDVTVHQSITQRLVGVGDVRLQTKDASDPLLILESIDSPLDVKEQIRQAVRRQRARVVRVEEV